jgi:hypothetical protein
MRLHPLTQSYSRTMQQAFGPYTDHILHPMADPPSARSWALSDVAITSILIAVVVGLMFGVFL